MTVVLAKLDAEAPGAGIVELLEEALVLAKTGHLSSLGMALVYRGGEVEAQWSYAPNTALLLGATARLQHGLHKQMD